MAEPIKDTLSLSTQEDNEISDSMKTFMNQLNTKFQEMSDKILSKVDDLANRVDELEKLIAENVQDDF